MSKTENRANRAPANLAARYWTTAQDAAVPESKRAKYCAVTEYEAGPLSGLRTACGLTVDADATRCPGCGRLFGRYKTRFRREPDLRVFGGNVEYLTCLTCNITFPYVGTVPLYCPWCGCENAERDGYVRALKEEGDEEQ